MMKIVIIWSLLLTLVSVMPWVNAEGDDKDTPADDTEMVEGAEGEEGVEGEPAPVSAIYLPLKPAFVVNYGGAGRLRYLKTEVSVRLLDAKAANAVRHHLPLIRNDLMMLFSAQTDESLTSQQGKEDLRQKALAVIQDVVKREANLEGVKDVFFTSLIVQK